MIPVHASRAEPTEGDEPPKEDPVELNRSMGRVWITSVKILLDHENADLGAVETAQFWNSVLGDAIADDGKGCLLAGWIGRVEGSRCKSVDADYDKNKATCNAKTPGSIPCSPRVFGADLCVVPKTNQWTFACTDAFLKSQGVDVPLALIRPEALPALGEKVRARVGIGLNELVSRARGVCEKVSDIGQDVSDCARLHYFYRGMISDLHGSILEPRTIAVPAKTAFQARSAAVPADHVTDHLTAAVPGFPARVTKISAETKREIDAAWAALQGKGSKTAPTALALQYGEGGVRTGPTSVALPRPRAAADRCSTIDHVKEAGPVRDRGTLGSSTAYSAAELMSYRNEEKFSPIATSLQTSFVLPSTVDAKTGLPLDPAEDGTSAVILAANAFGPCLEIDTGAPGTAKIDALYGKLRALWDERVAGLNATHVCASCIDGNANRIVGAVRETFGQISAELRRKAMRDDSVRLESFEEKRPAIEAAIQSSASVTQFLARTMSALCDGNKAYREKFRSFPTWGKSPESVAVGRSAAASQVAIDTIHRSLETGVIQEVTYRTKGLVQLSAPGTSASPTSSAQSESNVVVGRSYLSSQGNKPAGCYFLVKQSLGTAWPANRVQANIGTKAYFEKGRPGYFWVTEQDLANELIGITTFIAR